jgi:DNA-3-methyladenine glycosylase I
LDAFVWQFVQGQPKINRPASLEMVPTQTKASDALSKDLKKRGMCFVGATIMYAYMQAVGMVDDHIQGCFRCGE